MLSTAEIQAMRGVLNQTLPDSGTIYRRDAITSDGMGGFTDEWSASGTVECRISPIGRTPTEQIIAEQLQSVSLWTVTLPAETEIGPADRIQSSGRVLEVVAPLPRSWELCRRVVCQEVR